jgi:DNA-binding XRE family transcriptional regulator/mannose-6-phosphate isomerase-like protein (cupin superfamily)
MDSGATEEAAPPKAEARAAAPGIPRPVGERLRAHRERAGLSLRGLARSIGVSPSMISQIEHGKAAPSVGTLYAIVSELRISMDELFFDEPMGPGGEPDEPASDLPPRGSGGWRVPSEGPVLRRGNRLSLTLDTGVRWERLTASHDPNVDFLYCTYPVGAESCPSDALMTHTGVEYGLVLSGRMGATVGDDSYELEPGDSVAFDSTTPHRLWTLGDEPAIVVWTVVGRADDPRLDGA